MKTLSISTLFFLLLPCISHTQSVTDHTAIENVIGTMAEAWSESNGEKFASIFSNQHDFIVWNGYYFKDINRETNARNHNGIFHTIYANTQLFYVIDKLRFISDEVALVHVMGAVVKKNEPRPSDPQVLYTALLEKTGDKWEISSFHNLDLEIFEDDNAKKNSPIPPHVMYASWYNSK